MLELVREIWALGIERKKFFLIPLLALLVLIGGVVFLAEGSAVTPFIYALF